MFDRDILRRLFSNASSVKQGMISRGNGTALRLAEAGLTAGGGRSLRLTGLKAYRGLFELAEHFDDMAEDLICGMARVARQLFGQVPLAYGIGDAHARELWESILTQSALWTSGMGQRIAPCAPVAEGRAHTALTVPGQVNYCAKAYAMGDVGVTFAPRMRLVTAHINGAYFWDEIRAKGGAYGASSVVTPYGVVGLTSYRDPRLTDTFEVFDGVADWLESHLPDEDALGSLKVSTVGSLYFQPQSPIDEGMGALNRYLLGKTAADRQAEIQDILDATAEDFTAFASMLRRLNEADAGVRAALGNRDTIASSGLFDHVEEL